MPVKINNIYQFVSDNKSVAILVFMVTVGALSVSSDILLYQFKIQDYPGQYKKIEYISHTLYLFIASIYRILEYLTLSFFIWMNACVLNFKEYSKLVRIFFLLLFLSPLLYLFELLELLSFIVMTYYFQITDRVILGSVLIILLFSYYVILYMISLKIIPVAINKLKASFIFIAFILVKVGMDILLSERFYDLIRVG